MVNPEPINRDEREVNAPGALNLYSLRELEYRLGFSREFLRTVAANATSYYKPFDLPKAPRLFARKKQRPKLRHIDRPTGILKEVQDRIYHRLLRGLPLPTYLCGAVKGRSVITNVEFHRGAPIIVAIDIKSWFPSITPIHIYRAFRKILNCSHKVAKLLTALTTYDGRLPQGASTSSALANLVLYSIDRPLRARASNLGVKYSSFVDDLPFSGKNARQMIPVAISTLRRAGFAISRPKLIVMGAHARKAVNGVVVSEILSASREHRMRIRSALHHLRVGDIQEVGREKYVSTLRGRIVHLASLNPAQAVPFETELSRIINSDE